MFNFNQFYRMFEDRHRGSTALIKDRLSFYLPFVLPLKEVYPRNFAVDLGSGRGEWVEMLADIGFSPTGVDINPEMYADTKREDIAFENGDALDYLKSLPDGSQSLVSAFHLIEHVPFSYLADLLVQAERVLLPGGLLILETPNPENFRVATESFYLDPSHVRQVPIELVSFLVDHVGFKRKNIARLQERTHLLEGRIAVGDLLVNISPDYGIVAQKNAPENILNKFSQPFEQSSGISFGDLSQALEKQTQEDYTKMKMNTSEQINAASVEMQNQLTQIVENSFSRQVPELIDRYTEFSRKMANDAKTIESQAQQIQMLKRQFDELQLQIQRTTNEQQIIVDELISVYSSKSFRITRPLRVFARWVRQFLSLTKATSNKSMTVTTNATAVDLHLLVEPYYQDTYQVDNYEELKKTIEELRHSIARNEINHSKDRGRS